MGKIAQSRHFEFPPIAALFRNDFAARIGVDLIHADSQVRKLLRGEVRAGVAFGAFTFLVEEIQTILLLFGQRGLVAGKVAVVGRIARQDRALEGRNGFGDSREIGRASSPKAAAKSGA